jgi:DNA polymerase (family 10)
MDKKELIKIIEEIGLMLELKGENPFKARAYYNAARQLEMLDTDIQDLVSSGAIANVKGIGTALADKITTLVTSDNLPYYDQLKATIPEGIFDMLKIPGLGAKKVKVIYEKLNITSLGELEYACRENRLRDLTGFGQKSQDKILKNIELYQQYQEQFLYPIAAFDAEEIVKHLKQNPHIVRIEIAGSLRRKKEVVKDIDIVASCNNNKRDEIMDHFINYRDKADIIAKGNTKTTLKLNSGINADLRLVDDSEFPFTMHHFTGSKEHNTAMRSLAKTKNLKMNEYGLFRGSELITCKDENEIFHALGMVYIAPELRENRGEVEAALHNQLPDLYDGTPFYGIFHIHSTFSDGAHSVSQIAETCRSAGFEYMGISDHSKTAFYANGLTEERVLAQHAEIDKLNEMYTDFHIFKGIESDILADGRLDYSDDFLAHFDFVIASVHSIFNMSEYDMTRRICRALEHPATTMLGHPTGRLLLGREAYPVNMEKVIEVAGTHKKIIEINSSPYRLDLDWRLGALARKYHVKVALNPDAHSIEGINDYKFGIGIARKAGFSSSDILNTLNRQQVQSLFNNI